MNMEKIINIHIEKLPEGYFLATSDDIQGLVAQGRTISETIEIARDIVKKLYEAGREDIQTNNFIDPAFKFDYPIIIGI
jgi:predicted RNase H-like HicB family nuclease